MNNDLKVTATSTDVMREKALAHLLQNTPVEGLSAEEAYRAIAEKAWEYAQSTKDNRKNKLGNLLYDREVYNNELIARLRVGHEIVFNTLKKMTKGVPANLAWGLTRSYNSYAIDGIYAYTNSTYNPTLNRVDLIHEIGLNKKLYTDNRYLRFHVKGYNSNTVQTVDVPLILLTKDPIAIAQWVRSECYRHYRKTQTDARQSIARRIKDMEYTIQQQEKENQVKLDKLMNERKALEKPDFKEKRVKKAKPQGV